jgi:type I restriction enzyme S subunit
MQDKVQKMTPEIRFKGYTDDWVLRKLGEVVNITMGQSPSSVNYTDDSSYDVLVQGNADLKNGWVIPRVWTKQVTKKGKRGDIILSVRAPVGEVAKTSFDVVLGRGVASVTGNEFVYQALLRLKTNGYWRRLSTGSTFESINSNDIKNANLFFTEKNEQQAIGSLFKKIDNLIVLQQRKIDTLKLLKKALLQQMFPEKGKDIPNMRFTNFNEIYQQRKLKELLIKNSKKNKELSISNVESVSNKVGFIKQTEQFEDYSVASSNLSNYYVIKPKQFAYNPSRINVGSIAYKKEKDDISVVSPLYVSFSTKNTIIDDNYLWFWFKTSDFERQRQKYSEGGVRDTLSFNQFSEMKLMLPNIKEQKLFGGFVKKSEYHLKLIEQKFNGLKTIKKALLQKMFI